MKKIPLVLANLTFALTLFSCAEQGTSVPSTSLPEESKITLQTPVISLNENVITWQAVGNAKGYVVSKNDNIILEQSTTSYTILENLPGTYKFKVKAISSDYTKYLDSDYSNEITYVVKEEEKPVVIEGTDVYMVGDSTMSSFNDSYYYPRYGYGTQLENYLDEKATIKNLALSGRSSKSFIVENNYLTLKDSITAGDYLIIGFGHNDEKSDDPARYSSPTGLITDKDSFKYNLYEYYIKLALEKGATPILCTPIVRASSSNDYTGTAAHITETGDYAKAIRELGEETKTTVIDLTAKTKELYEKIGYEEAIKYHAWTTPNKASVDNTHLNIYGAKMVAYTLANELKNSNSNLKNYVKSDITSPTEADRVSNPDYVESSYKPFNESTYKPVTWTNFKTDSWYGTAFGDCGGSPLKSGFIAEEETQGVFKVGQFGTSNKGKISSSTEGIGMIFKQVSRKKNFKITANVEITECLTVKQAGFGLMLRDDIYVEQAEKNPTILSNYVAAGFYNSNDTESNILYSRENAILKNEGNKVLAYNKGSKAVLTIERLGQVVKTMVVYEGQTYIATYTDFDFFAIDNEYMYVGMYATRGTVATFTNVDFQITGNAIEA